jgi:6-phosphogluconolactonase
MLIEKLIPKSWDDRKDLIVPGNSAMTLTFCVEHFVSTAKKAILHHDAFFVALSGGSTPKALFEKLSSSPYKELIQWEKVHLFWSDERAVPPTSQESNYHMALSSGLEQMPIPKAQIHRMHAENNIQDNAELYEQTIITVLQGRPFDLIMLGMGEDGHTASLFPGTEALQEHTRLVVANFIPQKNTWRMTFTTPCINQANLIVIYVLGAAKRTILKEALSSPTPLYPIQQIGTPTHKALWIADEAAAENLSLRK